MIAADTNVVVRFLTEDDPEQAVKARHLFEQLASKDNPVLLNDVVLAEIAWVLRAQYGYAREDILTVMDKLVGADQIEVSDPPTVRRAIVATRTSQAGFADALIALRNRDSGADTTYTFDDKAARLPGMTLL